MSLYSCSSHSTPVATDQHQWIGCQQCSIDAYCASPDFFRPKHLSGVSVSPWTSQFTYDPASHVLEFSDGSQRVRLDSKRDFIEYWLQPSRYTIMWNQDHQTANVVVQHVDYGATGSGTTLVGAVSSELTGVLIAKAFDPDAHPFPVNPGGPAVSALTTWLWRCGSCEGMAKEGTTTCLACLQSSSVMT